MKEKLLAQLQEICEEEKTITEDTKLVTLLGWDSLSIIAFTVFVKKEFGVQFEKMSLLDKAETVGDLIKLVEERMK